jgi:NADH-quinone oxidoreductase subunit M
MSWLGHNILTVITFLPAVGAAILMAFPRGEKGDHAVKWFALAISIAAFIASLHLPYYFDKTSPGFQFSIDKIWMPSPNIHYHLAVDGISMWLVVLTTFLVPFSLIIQWNSVHGRIKEFFILMLLLESAMLGVFVALDLFLFSVFWEATLIPMALIIGIYGHERRIYAAVKFFLYTMIASVFMLAAIIWLYVNTGSFDFTVIREAISTGHLALTPTASLLLFLGFFVAFAVKVPLFPLHTWLPDAHVEAPTGGSVLLAGVLLKMGTYGLLRFNVGLFPEEARHQAGWIAALAIIGIIYGALVAMVQPNLKKLIAYSSVTHLGFIVLGIFTFTQAGTDGAIYQMLNHGVSTGALFMLAGIIYDRRHTYEIAEFGGLATPMPAYATLFMLITLSSIALPLMNGFVGEFLVLSGAFLQVPLWGVLAATGVIWSACYMLWMYQRVFYGTVKNPVNNSLPDLDLRERGALWPLAALALIMGVFSPFWIRPMDPAVEAILSAPTTTTPHARNTASLSNCHPERSERNASAVEGSLLPQECSGPPISNKFSCGLTTADCRLLSNCHPERSERNASAVEGSLLPQECPGPPIGAVPVLLSPARVTSRSERPRVQESSLSCRLTIADCRFLSRASVTSRGERARVQESSLPCGLTTADCRLLSNCHPERSEPNASAVEGSLLPQQCWGPPISNKPGSTIVTPIAAIASSRASVTSRGERARVQESSLSCELTTADCRLTGASVE